MNLRHLDAANADRWDAFVQARPEGTFYHLSGWQDLLEVIEYDVKLIPSLNGE